MRPKRSLDPPSSGAPTAGVSAVSAGWRHQPVGVAGEEAPDVGQPPRWPDSFITSPRLTVIRCSLPLAGAARSLRSCSRSPPVSQSRRARWRQARPGASSSFSPRSGTSALRGASSAGWATPLRLKDAAAWSAPSFGDAHRRSCDRATRSRVRDFAGRPRECSSRTIFLRPIPRVKWSCDPVFQQPVGSSHLFGQQVPFLAIWSASPPRCSRRDWIISMRSWRGAGSDAALLAVVMNMIFRQVVVETSR